ncbi:hypothetical protein [Mesoflavibacter sp. CH_XMU1422-2]|uniref:hypothetical protein n=1 Tax=Mesoflavibacter sp. CH_XMU1422-2 TaxID=3107770 RepID=UPI00300B85FF
MKKLLVVLMMFFALTSFANNSLKNEDIKSETNNLELKNLITPNKEKTNVDQQYIALCYVTIVNAETGETKKVYGIGSGSSPSAALSNCGSNAYSNAQSTIDGLQ